MVSRIVITRRRDTGATWRRFEILLNGRSVAKLWNGQVCELVVLPGEHLVHAKLDDFEKDERVTVQAGQTVRMICGCRSEPEWYKRNGYDGVITHFYTYFEVDQPTSAHDMIHASAEGGLSRDVAATARDVFLCHAGEDKTSVVVPLAQAFASRGISYWLDTAEIMWGDSLTAKVNYGLGVSRYVLVVLSKHVLRKNWPKRELYAALNIEATTGTVKVLPLLVGPSSDVAAILEAMPLIGDKLHLMWTGDPSAIADQLLARLR